MVDGGESKRALSIYPRELQAELKADRGIEVCLMAIGKARGDGLLAKTKTLIAYEQDRPEVTLKHSEMARIAEAA